MSNKSGILFALAAALLSLASNPKSKETLKHKIVEPIISSVSR